jgi:hypothetical protein
MLNSNFDTHLFTQEISSELALNSIIKLYDKALKSQILSTEEIVLTMRSIDFLRNKLNNQGELITNTTKNVENVDKSHPKPNFGSRKFLVQDANGGLIPMRKYYVNNYNDKMQTEKNSHAVCSELVKLGYIKIEEPSRTLLVQPKK